MEKINLKNEEQRLTLDERETQAEGSLPELNEDLSDDPSGTGPSQKQLQRSSPKLQILLEKLQFQNKQLWEALDMGKEEWQIGRKQICKAYVRTQTDKELAEEEIERLREGHKVDSVRRSQWERLVENETALCKRLGEQREEDQEKIYRLEVRLQIRNEKANEDRKASVVERVLSQKLVEDLSKTCRRAKRVSGRSARRC